jgi:serine/threonine protein kinase
MSDWGDPPSDGLEDNEARREPVGLSMPRIGEEVAGYRLRALLGRGGMSVVYQAEFLRLGNLVALKVLAPELANEDAFRTRFLQESRAAASLNHPNVIPIYDSGPFGDLLYISMRYVAGADLRTVLKAYRRLAPDQALLLVGSAGRGLDAAHRAGIVHRDVKPANILIERVVDDEPDHVYLSDFGIAKHSLSVSGLTNTGQLLGTLDYIAPEQIQGKPVDARTDIYSLGCVLYECLTGSVPFQNEVNVAVMWSHVEDAPEAPSSRCAELPAAVDDVILRAMAKRPQDRYASCREFMTAAHEALVPGSVDPSRRAQREARAADPPTVLGPAVVTPATPPAAEPVSHAAEPVKAASASAPQEPSVDRQPRRRSSMRLLPWALVAVVALAAVIVVVVSRHPSSSSARSGATKSAMSKSSMPAAKRTAPVAGPLMQAVARTNDNAFSKGLLPPSSCVAQAATAVICTNPNSAIAKVSLRTFSSLRQLYGVYTDDFRLFADKPFQANFHGCTEQQTYGEASWNHASQQSRKYSLALLESGHVDLNDAYGRLFCTFASSTGAFYIVWTVNPGHLLGVVTGSPHDSTWNWWHKVHHTLSVTTDNMSMGAS